MESIWKDTAALPAFPPLEQDIKTDVLIIGGGLAGLLCAWMLERDGIDYILVEADRIGSGITGNTTAKITSQHGLIYDSILRRFGPEKAKAYWQANEDALAQYRTLCRDIPCDFEEKDAYVYAADDTAKLEKELSSLERLGIPGEYVKKLPLPLPVAGAIRFRDQGQFNPWKFVACLSPRLRIHEHTKVLAYDGHSYITSQSRITAKKTIAATHFPLFNKNGLYSLKLYQHRSYVLALEGAADVDGMYIDEKDTGLSFRNHKNLLFLGGGSHRTGKRGGGWKELESIAGIYWPNARIAARWAAQDCMTLDGVPYIGQYAKRTPSLYVATGFNKWGITSSMAAATVLTALVQERESPYGDLFSPDRSILRPQLFLNTLESTVNLLTPTTPRCPHLGCALKWNEQEHSWDCPCHGSRFSREGQLLDNPAAADLKRKPSTN